MKEDRAFSDKLKVDGAAIKAPSQPLSPESPKRDLYLKSSRFRSDNSINKKFMKFLTLTMPGSTSFQFDTNHRSLSWSMQ